MVLIGLLLPKGDAQAATANYSCQKSDLAIHCDWGANSPGSGIPKDNFNLTFDQSHNFDGQEYFLQTLADDRVKVKVNNTYPINQTTNSASQIDQALLGKLSGDVPITTNYYEVGGSAAIYSDIVPYGSWLAYYYNNTSLSGKPVNAETVAPASGTLSVNNGYGAPDDKVNINNFSAKYTTAKHINAGDYVINARADDGIRVKIDGKVVLNRWTPSSYREDSTKIHVSDGPNGNVHWIEVDYLEKSGASKLYFSMNPYNTQISTNGWYGEFFANKTLSGQPVVIGGSNALKEINELDFNWGYGSPTNGIPSNNFSGIFRKKVNVAGNNNYDISVNADDGVRVYIDGKRIIDSWKASKNGLRTSTQYLEQGTHDVKVEYYEGTGVAKLDFNIVPTKSFSQTIQSVHYNWGFGSPGSGFSKDHFLATFNQSRNFASNDYFMQTSADDGVRVNLDGKAVIDRWKSSAGVIDRAYLGHLAGQHSLVTNYYEATGDAYVYSDAVPVDDWLAYYYNNESLSGDPVNSKVIAHGSNNSFEENNGAKSPATKINADHFSASYVSAKHLAAGDYILRTRADDGVRVLVDGKKVLDRWTDSAYTEDAVKIPLSNINGSDIHWIEVQYYDKTSNSRVYASIEPFTVSSKTWTGEIYENTSLQGQASIIGGDNALHPIKDLNMNWGVDAPNDLTPKDHFSASFQKIVNAPLAGTYDITVKADDGVRLYIDGKKVIDSWKASNDGVRTGKAVLSAGNHTVKVDYYEGSGAASLSYDMKKGFDYQLNAPSAHLNWGSGAPTGVLFDNFSVQINQSGTFDGQEYFAQTFAADKVKMTVNNKTVIDRQTNTSGAIDRAILGKLSGSQSVYTEYYENAGNAAIYSDITPFGSWLAYYYNNTSLSGSPVYANTIKGDTLTQDYGTGSPNSAVASNNFSARYVTAKRINAGDYIIQARADDGIRVLVDGKPVIDRFTASSYREDAVKVHISDVNGSNIHWVEVQYLEKSGASRLDVSMDPYKPATTSWMAEYYPNKDLTGNAVIVGGDRSLNKIVNPDFNWGTASPVTGIPVNNFSAKFTNTVHIDSTGTYQFKVTADDGVRLYVDGKQIINSFGPSNSGARTANIDLAVGDHTVQLDYLELTGAAEVQFSFEKLYKKVNVYNTTVYGLSLSDAVKYQMNLIDYARDSGPKTDQHPYSLNGYIFGDALTYDKDKQRWVVQNGPWNFRKCAGANDSTCPVLDVLRNNETVTILDTTTFNGEKWYKINYVMDTWEMASSADVLKYINPLNFTLGTRDYYQFLKLNGSANLNSNEVNDKILKGMGILEGKGLSFIKAGQAYNVNEIYLIAHALLETDNGYSQLASGVCYDPNKDRELSNGNIVKGNIVSDCSRSGKIVYNMYGINATDNNALIGGAAKAYSSEWFTPEEGIIGGGKWISEHYVNSPDYKQSTLYEMRWNPANMEQNGNNPHQYATDVGWASKQTYQIGKLYDLLSSYTNVFDIPMYR